MIEIMFDLVTVRLAAQRHTGLVADVATPASPPRPGSLGEGHVLVVGGGEWACPGRTGRGEAPRPAGPAEMSVASAIVVTTGGDAGAAHDSKGGAQDGTTA
ncbi:hypothetical protein GCM10027203_02280 [Nonomuraea fastidiosa]